MNKDQLKGAAKFIAGRLQEAMGHLIGSAKQVVQGLTRQVAGKKQEGHGDVIKTLKDFKKDHPE